MLFWFFAHQKKAQDLTFLFFPQLNLSITPLPLSFMPLFYVALVMWNIFHKTSGYIFSMTCYHVYQNIKKFHSKFSVTKYVYSTSVTLCINGGQPHILQKMTGKNLYLICR